MALGTKDLITSLIFVVLGVALYPVVSGAVTDANATGTEGTILGLIPMLYIFLIIGGITGYLYIKGRA